MWGIWQRQPLYNLTEKKKKKQVFLKQNLLIIYSNVAHNQVLRSYEQDESTGLASFCCRGRWNHCPSGQGQYTYLQCSKWELGKCSFFFWSGKIFNKSKKKWKPRNFSFCLWSYTKKHQVETSCQASMTVTQAGTWEYEQTILGCLWTTSAEIIGQSLLTKGLNCSVQKPSWTEEMTSIDQTWSRNIHTCWLQTYPKHLFLPPKQLDQNSKRSKASLQYCYARSSLCIGGSTPGL